MGRMRPKIPPIHDRALAPGERLLSDIRQWAQVLGFSHIGVAGVDLSDAEPGLLVWLEAGFHGGMDYMQRYGTRRARPAELVPGTVSVLTARMDYLPADTPPDWMDTELQRLHHRLPHAGHCCALPLGRAALYFLSDHRTRRTDSAGAAPADG